MLFATIALNMCKLAYLLIQYTYQNFILLLIFQVVWGEFYYSRELNSTRHSFLNGCYMLRMFLIYYNRLRFAF